MKKSIAILLVLLFALTSVAAAGPVSVTLASRPGVTMYGPLNVYAPPGDPAWGEAKAAVETYQPSDGRPVPVGAQWISEAQCIENYTANSWRWFHDEFTLACTAYNIQPGVVQANSDNAEALWFNGAYIGHDGPVDPANTDPLPAGHPYEWRTLIDYAITPQPGTNTLDFVMRNYGGNYSSCTGNPAALAYKTTVDAGLYSLPTVAWQPPVSLDNFDLLDGSTLPLKFKLYQGDALVMAPQSVTMKVIDAAGNVVATWIPGEGTDYLRFDPAEFHYIGNFHTKDNTLTAATYTAVVYDGCSDDTLGQITFDVVVSEGKGGRK